MVLNIKPYLNISIHELRKFKR
uniref:Uncharacterized protein n=1 Tax=Tetranychus urticae TaxID=32264 RepID=T1KKA4_TETUR